MEPQLSYNDVGSLYLVLVALALGVVFGVRGLLRAKSLGAALRCLGVFLRSGAIVVLGCGLIGVVIFGSTYAIGWAVHALNWWPY